MQKHFAERNSIPDIQVAIKENQETTEESNFLRE